MSVLLTARWRLLSSQEAYRSWDADVRHSWLMFYDFHPRTFFRCNVAMRSERALIVSSDVLTGWQRLILRNTQDASETCLIQVGAQPSEILRYGDMVEIDIDKRKIGRSYQIMVSFSSVLWLADCSLRTAINVVSDSAFTIFSTTMVLGSVWLPHLSYSGLSAGFALANHRRHHQMRQETRVNDIPKSPCKIQWKAIVKPN